MCCSCIWWHTMTLFGSCMEESGLIWAPCIVLHCVTGSIWYAGPRATPRKYSRHLHPFTSSYCNAIQCHPFHLMPNKRAIIHTRTDLSGRRSVSMACAPFSQFCIINNVIEIGIYYLRIHKGQYGLEKYVKSELYSGPRTTKCTS